MHKNNTKKIKIQNFRQEITLFKTIGKGKENAPAEDTVILIPDIFVEHGHRTTAVEIYQII